MSIDFDGMVARLEDVAGAANVSANPGIEIGSIKPRVRVEPASAEETAACLRTCGDFGAAVVPSGARTWLDGGNPLRTGDVLLSMRRMSRVVEYSPPDLTATLECGVALSEFNRIAKAEKQWLPLDPPGSPDSTIGAIVACGSSGTLRFGFGTPRDYVLGLTLAHADGSLSKSGGKVVKNVAGYDMNKLYTGSYGTLAVITNVTVKLRPVPERSSTLAITANDTDALFELARNILAGGLRPASLFVLNRALSLRVGLAATSPVLLVRFLDDELAVTYQVEKAAQLSNACCNVRLISSDGEPKIWRALADLDAVTEICVRLSVPMSQTKPAAELCASAPLHSSLISADVAAGSVRLAFDVEAGAAGIIERVRDEVKSMGGTVFVERAPLEVKMKAGAWNDPGPTASIMTAIKAKLDPTSILSPGRFVAGI